MFSSEIWIESSTEVECYNFPFHFSQHMWYARKIIQSVWSFFDHSKSVKSFCSKINVSSGVRTAAFWSGRSGLESLPCQIFIRIHLHLSEFPIVSKAQFVGQQGWEAVGTGSNPGLYLHFSTILISFRTKIFLKPGWVPLRHFLVLWEKNFERIVIPLLSRQFFDTRTFLKHKGPPTNFFGTVRQKIFDKKSW